MKIYTKTGDNGETGLLGGVRISKAHDAIKMTGALDETNSHIGLVRSESLPDDVDQVLKLVQNDLFDLGSRVAACLGESNRVPDFPASRSEELEAYIDQFDAELPPLKVFILNRDDWSIFVFGAGHVAQSLVKVLLTLSCKVTCIDPRIDWLDKMSDHDQLYKVCSQDLTVEAATITRRDFVVCMTMGHSTDRPVLATIFKNQIQPAFLGVIGSKSKRGTLIRELKSDGISLESAESFVCPIGLPIGTNQPAEIAISIAAQLLQRRDELKAK